MSTIPPNSCEGFMRAATVNMAMAQPPKAKAARASSNANPKAKTQMHRRSRTGVYFLQVRMGGCRLATYTAIAHACKCQRRQLKTDFWIFPPL